MSRKRKPKSKSNSPPRLSDARYQKLLIILLDAWESSEQGQDVFWDYGSGERPQKILEAFLWVAKRENVPVKIKNLGTSLRFTFPPSGQRLHVKVTTLTAVERLRSFRDQNNVKLNEMPIAIGFFDFFSIYKNYDFEVGSLMLAGGPQ